MVEVNIWLYSIISVVIVSLISLIGIVTLGIKDKKLNKVLIYLVSLSAGALFGGAFLHLLPEVITGTGFTTEVGFLILGGIILFFILEKIVHWHHCHQPLEGKHVHSFAIMNLIGDGFHNLLDGLIIGASYIVSIPTGIATTLAVVLHEIPQEIGDFGVLLHGGFSKLKAIMWNLVSALTAVIGVLISLIVSNYIEGIHLFLVPIAIGGFIYIAGADLIPEMHKHYEIKNSIFQLIAFILGILIMAALLFLE